MSPSTTSNAGSSTRNAFLAWGRLLRLSLATTAAADVVAGAGLAGRGAWTGPLLLGLCRAGNLATGMLACGRLDAAGIWLAAGYGAYVFLVAVLGRMEDGDEQRIGRRPRVLLLGAGACQLVPLAFGLVATAPLAALRIGWLALRTRSWTRASVLSSMGSALRLLLFYTASVAWLGGGAWLALGLLAIGYPLAWVLRQVFPPS